MPSVLGKAFNRIFLQRIIGTLEAVEAVCWIRKIVSGKQIMQLPSWNSKNLHESIFRIKDSLF